MFRRMLNGVAAAGLATALLAGAAVVQTASADFASDLSSALTPVNQDALIGLGKANPEKGAIIGRALGGAVNEDQAASVAGALAGGVGNTQFSATLFQGLGTYYPAARTEIAASILAADPKSEQALAAILDELNTAAGAGLLSNPGPGATPVNVNSEISATQEAFIKSPFLTRLGPGEGLQVFGSPGGTTSPVGETGDQYGERTVTPTPTEGQQE